MHASLAIFASGFRDCSFLCHDGGGDLGDQRDCIYGNYTNNKIEVISEYAYSLNWCGKR